MIINKNALYRHAPIKNMLHHKAQGKLASHGMTEAGYDIRIKQDVRFTSHFVGHTRKRVVFIDGKMHEGNFALASAIEEFQMPFQLVGVVHDKSTWARQQLSVFNTVIEPGWNGFLTLELVHHGQSDLYIPAGTGIAQVLFHSLANEAEYKGKYQNQEDKPVPAR